MKRALFAFLAGFLATLVLHQPVLWLLRNAGIAPFAPWSMTPVPPFGVPSVISLAFWGGVWGIIMIPVIARIRSDGAYFLTATIFGAILPTLVAALVSAPLHGKPIPKATTGLLITGLSVNAAWGLGTAIFFRLFARRK